MRHARQRALRAAGSRITGGMRVGRPGVFHNSYFDSDGGDTDISSRGERADGTAEEGPEVAGHNRW
jgi:hypothetical protein